MTEAQRNKFYFPNWGRACEEHDWKMVKGRLAGKRKAKFGHGDVAVMYDAVWQMAGKCAAEQHRAITVDDLRHGCHWVALGRDKSANDLTNAEVDHVVQLFRILADPWDLDAVVEYFHPENAQRERLVHTIERLAPEAYIQSIADDLFAGADWQSLDLQDLLGLMRKLQARKAEWNSRGVQLSVVSSKGDPF